MNNKHFLTEQTLRERMGSIRLKSEPMAAFRTDLYREIDDLTNKLQKSETEKIAMTATIISLSVICISLAAMLYLNG